jgi:hypothetical protein
MSEYDDNYENVFGKTQCERGSWVFCKKTQKLVPKEEYYQQQNQDPDHPSILKPIEEFVSPIDGSVISDRTHLREHNKRHGVTDMRDYGVDYFKRRGKEKYNDMIGNTKKAKRERVETIKEAMHKHGLH